MEGIKKQEERKIQKRRQGEVRECVGLGGAPGGGGGGLWEGLNYKFAHNKIACGKIPLHPYGSSHISFGPINHFFFLEKII